MADINPQPCSSSSPSTSSITAAATTTTKPPAFQTLSATYTSPTNRPFTHTHTIPTPPTTKTTDRTAYLAALRIATADMQARINQELTARMEEDNKVRESTSRRDATGGDESRDEDNYGEEVPEED